MILYHQWCITSGVSPEWCITSPVSPVVYHHCEKWRNKKFVYIYYKDLSIAILKREKYCEMRLNKYCVFFKIASLGNVHYS